MCKSKRNECAHEKLENKKTASTLVGLTELNETIRIMCGRNSSET